MAQLTLCGDSILKGVTYEQERYRLYHCKAFDAITDAGIAIENHSRMGATVDKAVSFLEKCNPFTEDTTVLLEYGGNDCDFDWAKIAENPGGAFQPHTAQEDFMAKYRRAVALAREKGAQVAMLSLIPIDAEKYFRWITRSGGGEHILCWLGDVSMLARWQEHYSHLVEELARSLQCPLIDVRRDFLLSHRFSSLIGEDGIHPTAAGHELLGERIAEYICG